MSYIRWGYLNRTLCDVLEEMRKAYESRNFAGLLGLIEEAQHMANSMEAALNDRKDVKAAKADIKELKIEYKALKKKVEKARKKADKAGIAGDAE